ncbi:HAD-IA family hydrolase [Frondihabitans cladoniiphilus]|uniref:HAD family phosphatase n=1 Tax=Frondihabitans cladoniiphilus TaxID=715785 RepID=A0ABP8VKF3_9MICO
MASLSIPGSTVVFDYGEVISRSPSAESRQALVDLAGVPAEPFWASYEAHRDALDDGSLGVVRYWKAIADDLVVTWSEALVHRLWVLDFTSWFDPEPGTLEVLHDLHEGGTRLALLSNAGYDFGGPFRYSPMGAFFERLFVSAELNDLKPRPSIYEHVLGELGIEPGEMVFVDNKRVNVEAAEALGIVGHVFTSPEELRLFLEALAAA